MFINLFRRKMRIEVFGLFLFLVCFRISAFAAVVSGTLIPLSSSTIYYSGSWDNANGVAVDDSGNIIVTGWSNNTTDYFTIKYDTNLNVISSATYDGGGIDYANGVAVDNAGNIIVTGESYNGSNPNYFTIKYDNNLNVISSTTYDGGKYDGATGVTVDNLGNIIVTGWSFGTDLNYFTIKYDNNLNVISSATYDGGGLADSAWGVAVDNLGNIIVTGESYNGLDNNYFTIKYDSNLNVISSATYDGSSIDRAKGVAIDNLGNIIIAGMSNETTDYFTIKYDTNLNVISSATYDTGGGYDCVYGVAVDDLGNIIVTGTGNITIKYDPNLAFISFAVDYNTGSGVAVDDLGNIIVIGASYNGTDTDFFTIKYNGSPTVSSISPSSGNRGNTLDITINGTNFYDNAEISFNDSGIIVNSTNTISSTQLTANITITQSALLGPHDVIVENIDGASGKKTSAFTVLDALNIPTVSSISPSSGNRGNTLDITINGTNFINGAIISFSGSGITVNSTSYLIPTELSVNITISSDAQLGYYDITITNPDSTSVTKTNAFKVKLSASDNLDSVITFPSPYNPMIHTNGLDIENLVAGSQIKIYTISGDLVCTLSDDDSDGTITWYGKNSNNNTIASGVYIAYIEGGGHTKKIKIAVQK